MATTRTRFAGKALSDSWESEEREHPQGCSFFCVLSSAAALLGLRAHRARGFCSPKGLLLSLHRAGGESKGPFSFAKENGPFGTPRERLRLAVSSSNDFCASGVEVPAWRYCFARRQWFCKTIYLCSYHPLLRSRWRLCCLTDAAHPLRVPLCSSCRSTA